MYNRFNAPRSSGFSRNSRNSGSSSRSGSGSRFSGSRGGGGSSSRDYSRYIQKAVPQDTPKAEVKNNFSDFNLDSGLKQNLAKKGYTQPTPIQDQAIPIILEGRDIVGLANTGTGKTGAFLIPLIQKTLEALNSGKEAQTLIVVPTRELAIQIQQELFEFTQGMRVFSACCVGGMDIGRQIRTLSKPNQFIVGTPGRLVDLVNRRFLNLQKTNYVVLDEVDRMLDMGFIEDIEFLIDQLPETKQSLFFSATLDRSVEPLIHKLLKNPAQVSVKTATTSQNVDQDIVRLNQGENKIDILHGMLKKDDFKKVLIFSQTKSQVDFIYFELSKQGVKVEAIHGEKSQGMRRRALDKFRQNQVDVLVATDVAARGLDISEVSHVINYEIPRNYEDYIHRIGRTGRAGQAGTALTFVN